MKSKQVFLIEQRFKQMVTDLPRDDLFIRETPEKTYFITLPHPSLDTEYILKTWKRPKAPREFVDLGRCVLYALKLGAASLHFHISSIDSSEG